MFEIFLEKLSGYEMNLSDRLERICTIVYTKYIILDKLTLPQSKEKPVSAKRRKTS